LLRALLELQELDLRIEALRAREEEIPKQKGKFEIHKKRLAAELAEREKVCKQLGVEQHECETDIEQMQAQIRKYDQQLMAVKKNEEYQALSHEIDVLKKQIGLKEERLLTLMVEVDEAKARLEEDRKRIAGELKSIEQQCAAIDAELGEAVRERKSTEAQRAPIVAQVDPQLLSRYTRIRQSKKLGAALVALNDEVCAGCHVHVTPQIANEVLAGKKIHACANCGRLLYHHANIEPVGDTA
jgi:uncharacterized protein